MNPDFISAFSLNRKLYEGRGLVCRIHLTVASVSSIVPVCFTHSAYSACDELITTVHLYLNQKLYCYIFSFSILKIFENFLSLSLLCDIDMREYLQNRKGVYSINT